MKGETLNRWLRLLRRKPEKEVTEELAFHLEERVKENLARGMDPDAARAAALQRLGNLEPVRDECTELLAAEQRADARRERLSISWLDVKLGVRMLAKYPGLSVIGVLAMAFAIWVGAGAFEFINQVVRPKLPIDGGDRIVGLWNLDAEAGDRTSRLGDFALWRELRSIEDLSAIRLTERNLIAGRDVGEPVEIAEMSASGFRVARVPALLGRTLSDDDERPDATLVVVIGHDVWQDRFGSDPGVLGKEVRIGRELHTVVGVMPSGYAFPVAQSVWVPFRPGPVASDRRESPTVRIFGRLADGVSIEEARAELTTLGSRLAGEFPDTHRHLRPVIRPWASAILNLPSIASLGLVSMNLFMIVLLALVCGNVALLMFARAAARENEIVVRSALGASRGRIILQLFTEALVMAAIGAVIGLGAVGVGLRWAYSAVQAEVFEGRGVPIIFHPSLSPSTIVYALLLTLLAAAIAGILPALKVSRGLGAGLREATTGKFRFGGVWTALIVVQVAVTVVAPSIAYFVSGDISLLRSMDPGFDTDEYLSAGLALDREQAEVVGDAGQARYLAQLGSSYRELERRLEMEPEVASVTFGERLPLMYHPYRNIEIGGVGDASIDTVGARRVSSDRVALDFFQAMNAPILAGRGFTEADLEGSSVAVVNQSFIDRVLGGQNPIGRRFRYTRSEERGDAGPDEPWYEIVGVVRDMAMHYGSRDSKIAGIYHPGEPEGAFGRSMAVHVRGDPVAFIPRLRALAAAVDPSLQLREVTRLSDVRSADVQFITFWVWMVAILSGIAVVLSLAGIYSVLAFTVSQRTREIGIRVALGGEQLKVALGIFRRPLILVGSGILFGAWIVGALALDMARLEATKVGGFIAYVILMVLVCLTAAIAPTRRALRIQPAEAMRADG